MRCMSYYVLIQDHKIYVQRKGIRNAPFLMSVNLNMYSVTDGMECPNGTANDYIVSSLYIYQSIRKQLFLAKAFELLCK